MDDLATAKKQLFQSLGDDFKRYLALMKLWFQSVLSKEEFDYEATKYLSADQVKLHNKFLLTLFIRCQHMAAIKAPSADSLVKLSPKGSKSKKRVKLTRFAFERRFVPANHADYVTPPVKSITDDDFKPSVDRLRCAVQEDDMPENFNSHLRMFVGVWEAGLDGMSNEAVDLMNLAIDDYVKNILSAVFSFKSSHRTRDNGRFRHAFGAPAINPYLKNAHSKTKVYRDRFLTYTNEQGEQVPDMLTTISLAEQEAMFDLACSTSGKRQQDSGFSEADDSVSLWHMFHALRLHRNSIPLHTVYMMNMERILNRLDHENADGSPKINWKCIRLKDSDSDEPEIDEIDEIEEIDDEIEEINEIDC